MTTLGRLSLVFILLAPAAHTAVAQARPAPVNRLTKAQAASLVELTVRHLIRAIPHHGNFSLDQNVVEPDNRFLSYQALGVWSDDQISAVLGSLTVNLQTAEVWDLSSCKIIKFRQLRILQKRYIGAARKWPGATPALCVDY